MGFRPCGFESRLRHHLYMKIIQYYTNQQLCVGTVEGDFVIPFKFSGDSIELINYPNTPFLDNSRALPIKDVRLAPPIANPQKIMAIGLNYKGHIKESKGHLPEIPIIFSKFPNSIIGNDELIKWDSNVTKKVDYEAELAVIIGKKAKNILEEEALDVVFGYTCANDVSARDLQFSDGQWTRGKSLDTFCPIGPWIVTKDELDPDNLTIRCYLNGRIMQDSNTNQMIFSVTQLVSFLSRHFTLCPGDIILTGTPEGVGAFRKPSVWLKDGDEIIVEIEGIGRLRNKCREIETIKSAS